MTSPTSWRVIPLQSYDGPMNMAIDNAIAEAVMHGTQPPTIRFYGWSSPAITLGRWQRLGNDINLETCRARNVPIVRRPTGGSAVLHLPEDLTYSVIIRDADLPSSLQGHIHSCYRHICDLLINTLRHRSIGLPAEQPENSPNDVRVYGCKISGNALVRVGKGSEASLLCHGTLLYNFDEAFMRQILPDKSPGTIGWVRKWRACSRQDVYATMFDAFIKGKTWKLGCVSEEEANRAQELVQEKYGNLQWTITEGTVDKGSCYDHIGRGETGD